MPTKRLTARFVDSIKPDPAAQVEYWDADVRRLGLRVLPSGRMSWVIMYRHNRRLRRMTLDQYPTMTLAAARKRAVEELAKVSAGRDPATEKAANRCAKTFQELANEYMERHAKPKKKSWMGDQQILNHDCLPRWRFIVPKDITRGDVRALVEAVADRGAKVHANRVLALVRKVFNFAVERDWLEHSPCQGVKRPSLETPRDRVLSEAEIKAVWNALENEEPPIRAAFRLCLLTAQRPGEVLNMQWSHVDLESGWWTIPATATKNKLSHRVPLNAKALSILKTLRQWQKVRLVEINRGRAKKGQEPRTKSESVFPSKRNFTEPTAWIQKAAGRIRDASEVQFRPHDLRRTAASHMTRTGTPRLVVAKILNHKDSGVTAVYDRHSYDAEKRQALDKWGLLVEDMLTPRRGAKVIPMESTGTAGKSSNWATFKLPKRETPSA